MESINSLIQINGRLPGNTEIANDGGLSEETIGKYRRLFSFEERTKAIFKLLFLPFFCPFYTYDVLLLTSL